MTDAELAKSDTFEAQYSYKRVNVPLASGNEAWVYVHDRCLRCLECLGAVLGVELPIIQAPMAGSQGSALAIAVSNAGGLGSLPCAMLGPDQIRAELKAITAATSKPYNVNFFVHKQPAPDPAREDAWRKLLAPYFAEHGIDPASIQAGPQRVPFDDAAADVLEEFKPPVVSFHFGLPSDALMRRVKSWGSTILSSATTLDEAASSAPLNELIRQFVDMSASRISRMRSGPERRLAAR